MPLGNCCICICSMEHVAGSTQQSPQQHVAALPCGHVFHEKKQLASRHCTALPPSEVLH
ncbi:hypothetical protein T484DRAFT_1770417 [Baffinella frigidus]|nr:hypothetical protein T484DRAFT_1770417 [Cryptophyta sp. CCMP2293]